MKGDAFWIDETYDREYASDGVSRFSGYVRQRRTEFVEAMNELDRVTFAAAAWRVATSPVMAPGYVRQHKRVRSARLYRNYEDGGICATVELVSITPRRLEDGSPQWRSWPREHGRFYEPEGPDLISARYLLTTTTAAFPLSAAGLPVCTDVRALETATKRAVELLVVRMNDAITPLVRHLERESS
ncbi:hypothetical protein [Nonomuraea ceibae]|uniref:hypothetical protein n=1 Tax=Nonomuraea ceibae TaxID=1935170 RepID=UPI001C6047DB|nr:hypothetical protein [Nonomuraea ceibae]